MRRKEKELTDREEVEAILKQADICRLAMSVNDQPYIVAMNFGYADDKLYFHCAKEGRKLDMILQNPNVCFQVEGRHEMAEGEIACKWTMKFESVVGFGTARIVEDQNEKEKALHMLMGQYSNQSFSFTPAQVNAVGVIVVDVEEMRGKRSGF